MSDWQFFCSSRGGMMVFLLIATLTGLLFAAARLSRNRRTPDAWEGGLLWLMSFLVIVVLLVRS